MTSTFSPSSSTPLWVLIAEDIYPKQQWCETSAFYHKQNNPGPDQAGGGPDGSLDSDDCWEWAEEMYMDFIEEAIYEPFFSSGGTRWQLEDELFDLGFCSDEPTVADMINNLKIMY